MPINTLTIKDDKDKPFPRWKLKKDNFTSEEQNEINNATVSDGEVTGEEFTQLVKKGFKKFIALKVTGNLVWDEKIFTMLSYEGVDFTKAKIIHTNRTNDSEKTSERFCIVENDADAVDAIINRINALQLKKLEKLDFEKGVVVPDIVLNLLQDKTGTIEKLSKDKTLTTWQNALKEAKKSAEKLARAEMTTSVTGYIYISPADLIKKINEGHRFFRSIQITGDLDLSKIKNLSDIDFGNAIFTGSVNFSDCKLNNANFQNADFRGNIILDGADIRAANFQHAQFDASIHVDEKTIRDTRTRLTGYISGKPNWKNSEIKQITYQLGSGENKVEAIVYSSNKNAQGLDRSKGEGDIEIDAKNASELFKIFKTRYAFLRAKENWLWRQRGDMVARLNNTKLTDLEKIQTLFRHAQNEKTSKTYQALQEALKEFKIKKNTILERSPSELSVVTTTPRDPSTRPASVVENSPELEVQDKKNPLWDFFIVKANQISMQSSEVVIKKADLQNCFSDYKNSGEELITLNHALQTAIKDSHTILDRALASFSSPDLVGNDLNDSPARKAHQNKILAAYIFLKVVTGEESVAEYNRKLKEIILPGYLKHIVYHQTHSEGHVRHNLIAALLKESGVAENVFVAHSDQRTQTSRSPAIFHSSKDREFLRDCQSKWEWMSFADLKNVLDQKIVVNVNNQMKKHIGCDSEILTRLARQYYLAELIKAERFEEAKYEASAMKEAFGNSLFSKTSEMDAAFSVAIDELKKKMIQEVQTAFSANIDNAVNQFGLRHKNLADSLNIILNNLGVSDEYDVAIKQKYTAFFNASSYISHGITTTKALQSLANYVLERKSLDANLLEKLNPATNYYSFVWIDESKKIKLVNALTIEWKKESDNSRKELLSALITMINNAVPISKLLTPNEANIVPLSSDAFKKMIHAVYRVDDVKIKLQNVLDNIWGYKNFSKVIIRNTNDELSFATPTDQKTKSLIGRDVFDSSDNNFRKYMHAYNLHKKLSVELKKLTDADRDCQKNCASCFQKIEEELVAITLALGDEAGKNFGGLISTALESVKHARTEWIKKVDQTVCQVQPSVLTSKRVAPRP